MQSDELITFSRRKTLKQLALAVATLPLAKFTHGQDLPLIRIGTTPVFLDQQLALIDAWRKFLEVEMQARVVFVQRNNYREIVELLQTRQLDCAWLCGYPYVRFKEHLELVSVPVFRGAPLYESYLITPSEDSTTRDFVDLHGKVFAFSDPLSNSGYLYPRHALWSKNKAPDQFFSRTFFTLSHRKVVEAVAVGLAQAGAVDGYVWESLAKANPQLTAKTRVVAKSPRFGFPPLVAPRSISPQRMLQMRHGFEHMADVPEGRHILAKLNLDGFAPVQESLYNSIANMMQELQHERLLT